MFKIAHFDAYKHYAMHKGALSLGGLTAKQLSISSILFTCCGTRHSPEWTQYNLNINLF
jgi:hypothetical protein